MPLTERSVSDVLDDVCAVCETAKRTICAWCGRCASCGHNPACKEYKQ